MRRRAPRSPSMLAASGRSSGAAVQPLGWPWPVQPTGSRLAVAAPRLAVAVFGVLAHGFRKRASQSVLDALCAMLACQWPWPVQPRSPSVRVRLDANRAAGAADVRRLRCWQPVAGAPVQPCSPLG